MKLLGSGTNVPSADDFIDETFGSEGYLANRFRGYQPREGQIALARAVDDAFVGGHHLMAEAGTSTGKSFGYLVPATYYVARKNRGLDADDPNRQRVVVVTANIALSEQLIDKDLPFLSDTLPWKFSYSLMKGKNNYLCLSQMYDDEKNGLSLFPGDIDPVAQIKAWAIECMRGNGTGDMSELSFKPSDSVWNRFSVSPDSCKGSRCSMADDCFALKATKKAKQADVIVTNYHLYLMHLSLRRRTGLDLILPPHEIVVWDECHKAADTARKIFGFKISAGAIRHAARRLMKVGGKDRDWHMSIADGMMQRGNQLFHALYEYKRSGHYKSRIKRPLENGGEIGEAWTFLNQHLRDAGEAFVFLASKIEALGAGKTKPDLEAQAEFEKAALRIGEIRSHIASAMTNEAPDENVYFLENEERKNEQSVYLLGQPIHVAPTLRTYLFEQMRSVICTSATMTTGNSFDYVSEELGCDEYRSLEVESPFDWPKQAVLVLPDGVSSPKDERDDFKASVADIVHQTIQLASGRTLGLFTSVDMVRHVYDTIKDKHSSPATVLGFRLYKQGDMPTPRLIEAFKADIGSVLLGTETFWAGVDIPGEALSAVVIDRIPFPTHEDPILDAISERDSRWFKRYSIPRATLQLKQGIGRAIRSTTDTAAIVIVDSRLRTEHYGKRIVRSMPPIPVHTNMDAIQVLLRKSRPMTDEEFLSEVFS